MIEPRLYYLYAEIDAETGECIGMRRSTEVINHPTIIRIPVYDYDYVGKFYINGAWYEDAEGTIPWSSSML